MSSRTALLLSLRFPSSVAVAVADKTTPVRPSLSRLSLSILPTYATMPVLAGIFSKKDKSKSKSSSPTLAAPPSASAGGSGGSTIRVVDDPNKSHAQSQPQPQPQFQSPFTSAPSLPTDYVLPEISLFSADNGALDDAISITASSSSAHPPSSSPTLVTQPVAPTSSSMLRLVNPFRKKSPSGNTHCESLHPSIPPTCEPVSSRPCISISMTVTTLP